jgi:hypothetical protein
LTLSPHRRFLALPVLLLWCAAIRSHASAAVALDLPALVAQSRTVAVADAAEASSFWLDGRIVTDTVVRVIDPILGAAAGRTLVVRTLGGEVGELGQRVAGEASLVSGRRYLLFLEAAGEVLRPVGLAQGALPVVEISGAAMVLPPVDPPLLLSADGLASVAAWLAAPRPLVDVLVEVREEARRLGR